MTVWAGSPIVDTLANVSEAFVADSAAARGSMTLVDSARMAATLARISGPMMQAAGGSAGNTVLALARLGSSAALLGRLGEDDTGRFFRACHSNAGARTDRRKSGPGASARCLSLITPAAQRTMMTDLGAAAGIGPADISEADFDARLVYSEGYVMYNRPYLDAVLDLARAAGAYIGFDLGSYSVVDMM